MSTGFILAGLLIAAPSAASAQTTAEPVKAIDKAGETAATMGAPGTVVPDAPGMAVAPGIQAPVETPVRPQSPPKEPVPAAK